MDNLIEKARKIHLIGIGGIGVSGLAQILLKHGKKITGSDNVYSTLIKKLEKKGIKIFIGQKERNISSDIDLVIHSQAITSENPEYKKALSLKIPIISYPEAVGFLMNKKKGIAIAGTHGKTTTSALIVNILQKNNFSPSFLIGGEIIGKGNSGVGEGEYLVVEACEYKRSFLNYYPEIAVITNIEEDHLDYYKNLEEIKKAFEKFCKNVRENGFIVCWEEDDFFKVIRKNFLKKAITFGLKEGMWQAKNIEYSKKFTSFECWFNNKFIGKVKIKIKGLHNVLNTLASFAVGDIIGIPWENLKKSVEEFKGVHRRCEIIKKINGITIMDDYGHHPTEIKSTLKSIREIYPKNRLIVVFQPHQYSRTRFLLKDFASSFLLADKVIVPDIYFVRDSLLEKRLVNAKILVERIRKNQKEAIYIPTFSEIVTYLKEIIKQGDIVLTIGAGPVNEVGKELIKELEK